MKRLIFTTTLFVLLSMMVQAAKYLPFDTTKELKGPVKSVSLSFHAGSNVSLYYGGSSASSSCPGQINYYDSLGREIKSEHYFRKKVDYVTITTYDSTTSISRTYDSKNQPNGHYIVKHYNQTGLLVCEILFIKDTIDNRDSIVYNQWEKPVVVYNARGKESFRLIEAYKYDSIGNLIGMRSFDKDGKKSGGFDVQYDNMVITVCYMGNANNGSDNRTVKYYYDEQHRLIRIKGSDYKTIFSKFDKYGNWTECEQHNYYNSEDYSSKTVRKFTYRETNYNKPL